MTQPDLFTVPPPSLVDQLATYFRQREGRWIDGRELSTVAGCYGWRTRISDCRKRGMQIENRQRIVREHAVSCPRTQFWDASEAECPCYCGKPRKHVVSEYRWTNG